MIEIKREPEEEGEEEEEVKHVQKKAKKTKSHKDDYSVYAKLKAETLKHIINAIGDINDEMRLRFDVEGIRACCMDKSQVGLVTMFLDCRDFIKYRCYESMALGINMPSMKKIMKTIREKNADVILSVPVGNHDVIDIKLIGANGETEYQLRLLDIVTEELGVPESKPIATVDMPSSELSNIISDFLLLGAERVLIHFDPMEGLCVSSTSQEIRTMKRYPFRHPDIIVSVSQESRRLYGLKMLKIFLLGCPLSERVRVSEFELYPVEMFFGISPASFKGTGEEDDTEITSYVRYFLAPKVQDEDAVADGNHRDPGEDA